MSLHSVVQIANPLAQRCLWFQQFTPADHRSTVVRLFAGWFICLFGLLFDYLPLGNISRYRNRQSWDDFSLFTLLRGKVSQASKTFLSIWVEFYILASDGDLFVSKIVNIKPS